MNDIDQAFARTSRKLVFCHKWKHVLLLWPIRGLDRKQACVRVFKVEVWKEPFQVNYRKPMLIRDLLNGFFLKHNLMCLYEISVTITYLNGVLHKINGWQYTLLVIKVVTVFYFPLCMYITTKFLFHYFYLNAIQ